MVCPGVSCLQSHRVQGGFGERLSSARDTAISLAEVSEVVKKLLRGTAPSMNDICPEMLKALDIVELYWVTGIFSVTWRSGTVPVEWQTRVVIFFFFQKGDQMVCSSNWCITPLSLPGKGYARVLERSLQPIDEPQI